MKTLDYVLNNYDNFSVPLEDRLGKRLCQFLTAEQMEHIGFEYTGEAELQPIEWNEENILNQLKKDVEFGIEKAINHRGISASLMFEVCKGWCIILENGLEDTDYGWYGCNLFEAINDRYQFGLVTADTFNKEFYEK